MPAGRAPGSRPIFPRPVKTLHLPFHDPLGEPLESFVRVRDDIRAHLVRGAGSAGSLTYVCTMRSDGRSRGGHAHELL